MRTALVAFFRAVFLCRPCVWFASFPRPLTCAALGGPGAPCTVASIASLVYVDRAEQAKGTPFLEMRDVWALRLARPLPPRLL